MANSKKTKKSSALDKAKKLLSKGKKNTAKKSPLGAGQNPPQSKSYSKAADKVESAKSVGWRWTDEGAKKLGKKVSSKPSLADIKTYRGKTFKITGKPNPMSEDGSYRYVYIERRVDKSDVSRKDKFADGGTTLVSDTSAGAGFPEFKKGGQTSPQSASYSAKRDKDVKAKRVGYRYTDALAKKLGIKDPTKRPTPEHIRKYLGKGVYWENRKDKSDVDPRKKFAAGGDVSDPQLLIDGHHGVFIPKLFSESFDLTDFGFSKEQAEEYKKELSNPDGEYYWETWEEILNNAKTKEGSYLMQDDDLWLLPERDDWEEYAAGWKEFAAGGKVKNQYKKFGTIDSLWDAWTESQRRHFINDHLEEMKNKEFKKDPFDFVPLSSKQLRSQYPKESYYLLREINSHMREGQYKKGGSLRQAEPQNWSGKYNEFRDMERDAKPVGYRYTDALAKRLRVDPQSRPTKAHIEKYLGNGVYFERRLDKSDGSRKLADGGIVFVQDGEPGFLAKGGAIGKPMKMKDGSYASHKVNWDGTMYYVAYTTRDDQRIAKFYGMDKNFVKEMPVASEELQSLVKENKIKKVKDYEVAKEQFEVPDKPLKEMNYGERQQYIEDNYADQIKSASFDFTIYETGDTIEFVGESMRDQHIQIMKDNADYTEKDFEKKTGLKIDGFELQYPDGEELKEVAADNTYNWGYLGGADFNIRVYEDNRSDEGDKFYLSALVHMGGDIRGGYGQMFIFEGESQDEVWEKFSGLIRGNASINIAFNDGSNVGFYSQQDSDVWYFEPSDDKPEGVAAKFVKDFESFGSWDGDTFLEETVELANPGKRVHSYKKGGSLRQAEPQNWSGKYNEFRDMERDAKPVGYRYTDALAKRLRIDPQSRPTKAHIEKYLGNGVYFERRLDKSDGSRRLADGGALVDLTTGVNADPRFDIYSPDFMARGGKTATNEQMIKALIKDLESTPHGVGLMVMRERMVAHAEADLKSIKKNPEKWQNPILGVGMFEDYCNRVIKYLGFKDAFKSGGQTAPQHNWSKAGDKMERAKPVGYRFTDKRADKLGKKPFTKPTLAEIEKYLGKGVYFENRKDKSDVVPKDKLEAGGEFMAKGGSPRIANNEARTYVENQLPFRANNLDGRLLENGDYVVMSYGYWPLWYWSKAEAKWYGNSDKYSVTTSKHSSQSRPGYDAQMVNRSAMDEMVMKSQESHMNNGGEE